MTPSAYKRLAIESRRFAYSSRTSPMSSLGSKTSSTSRKPSTENSRSCAALNPYALFIAAPPMKLVMSQGYRHIPAADRCVVLVKVARNRAIVVSAIQGRRQLATLRHHVGTAVRELATADFPWRRARRRRSGLDLVYTTPADVWVRQGDRVDKQLGVRMLGLLDDFLHTAHFRYGAAIEHVDVLA